MKSKYIFLLCFLLIFANRISAQTTILPPSDIRINNLCELTWTDNSNNETGFVIERSLPDSKTLYEVIGEVGANVTSYPVYGNILYRFYYYRIKAINANNSSTYVKGTALTKRKIVWDFENTNLDQSGYVSATLYGGVTYSSLNPFNDNSYSINLNSTGKYIDCGMVNISNYFSISGWCFINGSGGKRTLFSNRASTANTSGFWGYYNADTREFCFATGNGSNESVAKTVVINDVTAHWVHFTYRCSVSGLFCFIYINGELKNQNQTILPNFKIYNTNIRLGQTLDNMAGLGGLLDAVTISPVGEIHPTSYKNLAPVASNISVSGTRTTNSTLIAKYTYSDKEADLESSKSGTYFEMNTFWILADSPDGRNESEPRFGLNYIPTLADTGKYICFLINPRAQTGNRRGEPTFSVYSGPIKPGSATPPIAPSNVLTLFVNPEKIDVAWKDNSSDEINFVVEQSQNSQFSSFTNYTLGANVNRLVVTGLTANTTYYFRIKSSNAAGSSMYSNVISVKTTPFDDFPLSIDTNKHLVNRLNKPFLILGDSPWSLIVGPDMALTETYLDNRKQKGVNAIILNLIEHFDGYNGPGNAYNQFPFLVSNDFSTPNPAYFDHVDFVLGKAQEKGMAVFLFPAYLGANINNHEEGWYNEILANGTTKMYQYGRYLGSRYKYYKNIIWMIGGDCSPGNTIEELHELVRGIKDFTGSSHLFSVHNARGESGITKYPFQDWNKAINNNSDWIDLNTTYGECTASPTYLLEDFKRSFPSFFIEGLYETDSTDAVCVRSQMYWPVLMGSGGSFFGNNPLFKFNSGWQNLLDIQGSYDLKRSGDLLKSRVWSNLVPDTNHTLLVFGYQNLSKVTDAVAAFISDKTNQNKCNTLIAYTPEQRTLGIQMARMAGTQSHAWWYRPSSGDVYNLGLFNNLGFQFYTPPFAGDWILVLDNASLELRKPGILNDTVNSGYLSLPVSLEEYYKLDETSGTAFDSKGVIHSESVLAKQGNIGIRGKACFFDGNTNKIILPDHSNWNIHSNSNLSVSAWVSFASDITNIWGNIFGTAENYSFQVKRITNGNYQIVWFGGASISFSSTFKMYPGVWYHLVVTKSDNSEIKFYMDNVLLTTTFQTSTNKDPVKNYIGGVAKNDEGFKGKIDELGIWKKVLTPLEVSALYNYGLGLTYPFNNPSAKIVDSNKDIAEGIENIKAETKINPGFIYPNPAFNELYIAYTGTSNALILIYNMQGKLETIQPLDGAIDISMLKKGVYLVKLLDNNIIQINRLIKE